MLMMFFLKSKIIFTIQFNASNDHFLTDEVVLSSDHYCTDTVATSGDHCFTETVATPSDHFCIDIQVVVPSSDH